MAEMKNICGKIPVELHEKVRAEIEEKDTSTQIFIQQVIEEHFNRLEGKGEESMEKRTLAVQVTEDLFQRVKWAVAKEGIKQKDFLIRIIEKAMEEVEAKWKAEFGGKIVKSMAEHTENMQKSLDGFTQRALDNRAGRDSKVPDSVEERLKKNSRGYPFH